MDVFWMINNKTNKTYPVASVQLAVCFRYSLQESHMTGARRNKYLKKKKKIVIVLYCTQQDFASSSYASEIATRISG